MRTTQKERAEVMDRLIRIGLDYQTANSLRRISMTLRNWFELECGNDAGHIERDEKSGKPFFYNARSRFLDPKDPRAKCVIPDRERGARQRLAGIMARFPGLVAYIQGDCRGASVHILKKDQIREGENLDSIYNRGVAVY